LMAFGAALSLLDRRMTFREISDQADDKKEAGAL